MCNALITDSSREWEEGVNNDGKMEGQKKKGRRRNFLGVVVETAFITLKAAWELNRPHRWRCPYTVVLYKAEIF